MATNEDDILTLLNNLAQSRRTNTQGKGADVGLGVLAGLVGGARQTPQGPQVGILPALLGGINSTSSVRGERATRANQSFQRDFQVLSLLNQLQNQATRNDIAQKNLSVNQQRLASQNDPAAIAARERAKAAARREGEEAGDNAKRKRSYDVAVSDLKNTINAFDQTMTGYGSMVGNLAGLTGFGKESGDIKRLETLNTTLVPSMAKFITEQKGRDLSEAEQAQLMKAFRFNSNMTDPQFVGQLQGLIDNINARIPNGGQLLPDASTLFKQIKSSNKKSKESGGSGDFMVGQYRVRAK